MNKYQISFIGRTKGACGIRYGITATVEAENEDKAVLALYEKYEHVMVGTITKVN